MITRVRAKNFRSLADVDVTLGPLTVLVGKNGAGKSAFIDVLRFVRDMLMDDIAKALGQRQGFLSLCHSGAPSESPFEISLHVDSPLRRFKGDFGFALGKTGLISEQGKLTIPQASYDESYRIERGRWHDVPDDSPFGSELILALSTVGLDLLARASTNWLTLAGYLANTEIFSASPHQLRHPQNKYSENWLYEDARNFASLLQEILLNPEAKSALLSHLRFVVSSVTDLRVIEASNYLIIEVQHEDGSWRNLENESDGTVRLLGILCALAQIATSPGKAGIPVVIEEPEISIYPEYLEVLANVIREASQTRQVIITTQSPDLISCFAAEEIRVVENVGGVTKIGPLDQHQREVLNQKLFSLGDLLRVEGLWRDESHA